MTLFTITALLMLSLEFGLLCIFRLICAFHPKLQDKYKELMLDSLRSGLLAIVIWCIRDYIIYANL